MEDAFALRSGMVDRLKAGGVVTTEAVEAAMRHVPRDLFIPEVDVATASMDKAVIIKPARDGAPISSASQPTIVAIMLECLQVAPGQRVLEIGTGTGYNAALLAALVGRHGSVVSVELEPDLADRAARVLARAGSHDVEVVTGDGRNGVPATAATAGEGPTAGNR